MRICATIMIMIITIVTLMITGLIPIITSMHTLTITIIAMNTPIRMGLPKAKNVDHESDEPCLRAVELLVIRDCGPKAT